MVNKNFLRRPEAIAHPPDLGRIKPGETYSCYDIKVVVDRGRWLEINPLVSRVPIFLVELIIVTFVTRMLILVLKPFRQPPFVAELLAGILTGSSVLVKLQKHWFVFESVFSVSGMMIYETVGNIGLVYHLFIIGLETDLSALTRIGNKAWGIGILGALFPFGMGVLLYYSAMSEYERDFGLGCIFWGVALSVTGSQVVSTILTKMKLLHSELARVSLSSALVNDLVSWLLLIFCAAVTSSGENFYWSLLASAIFVVIAVYMIKPSVLKEIRRTREGEDFNEATLCVILTTVLGCGLFTDLTGAGSIFGAFVLGLILPQEELGPRFIMTLQGFVSDLLMPLFFAGIGMRTHLDALDGKSLSSVLQVVLLASLSKIISAIAAAYFFDMPFQEGLSLGFLMNTKGVMALVAITVGRDFLVMNDQAYTVMVLAILVMTVATTPVMNFLYGQSKRFLPSKHRALEKLRPDAELRVLACVHEIRTARGITALLEATNATKQSPICVFALQLIQLTKHMNVLLFITAPKKSGIQGSSRANAQTDQLFEIFRELEQENRLISTHPLTAMSPYPTMHKDVCTIAEDKRVTLIILPFHKRQTIHNQMEETNPEYRDVNKNVLANAPCSVGILIDRGIGYTLKDEDADRCLLHDLRIATIFLGGPDDREALAYTWRMAGHPNTFLTVLRFVPGDNAMNAELQDILENGEGQALCSNMDVELENQLDHHFINGFKAKTASDTNIEYIEMESNNGAETVATLRNMAERFDLYVVGRGLGVSSPLKMGLDDWIDCPELGSLGDLLLTSDFSSDSSVLVIQQYLAGKHCGEVARSSYSNSAPYFRREQRQMDHHY